MSKICNKKSFLSRLKKGFLGISLPAIIASLLTIGGTFALLTSVSDVKYNEFFAGEVECEVVEVFDGTLKSSIKIKNTGNTDAYIRLSLVSYFQNEDKKIVGHSASVPKFTLGSDWKLHDGYYYYLNPVKPDALTGEMLATPMELIIETDRDEKNFYQVVEVFAEAVQAFPDDAVLEAWPVVKSVSSSNQLQF